MDDTKKALREHYRLGDKIGEGGMGAVYRAYEHGTDRRVAIKILHKSLVSDPASVERFRQEALTSGALKHPNVCAVLDVGEDEGAPFLVMELLEGENLASRLSREGVLQPRDAVALLVQVLDGLTVAHAHGVLHRDLKPENIFLALENALVVPKLLDFGVAKFLGDDAARVKMTRTGALIGTPAYMSPEQALGLEDVDFRSDIWALGVVLYELLSGQLPYEASNYNAMLVKIATESPRPLEQVCPALDAVLVGIVARALRRDRRTRIESAELFARSLRAWLAGEASPLPPLRPALSTPSASTTPMSWAEGEGVGVTPRESTRRLLTLAPYNRALPPGIKRLRAMVSLVLLGMTVLVVARALRQGTQDHGAPDHATPTVSRDVVVHGGNPESEALLQIQNLPDDAACFVQGHPVILPAKLQPGETVRVEVRAAGFEPWVQTVRPMGALVLVWDGRPLPADEDKDAGPLRVASDAAHGNLAAPRGGRANGRDAGHARGGIISEPPF